ncbi:MAG: hypothetical protein U5R14_15785 [Gemmatimonadota bacterium]|nr:hypothetical protein [Gemmatimonadota bacterium]
MEILGEDGRRVGPGEDGEVVVTDLNNLSMPLDSLPHPGLRHGRPGTLPLRSSAAHAGEGSGPGYTT